MPMLNFFDPSFIGDLRRPKWCCGERADLMWEENNATRGA
jgi:hypothetical protein